MKVRILTVLAAFAFFFSGSFSGAQAQQLSAGGALNLAFISGSTAFGLRGVFNADQIGGPGSILGIRGAFDLVLTPSVDIGLGADVFAKLRAGAVDPYFGGGIHLYFVGGFAIAIQGLAGIDFGVAPGVDLFAEFSPGVYISGGRGFFIAGLGVGIRVRI